MFQFHVSIKERSDAYSVLKKFMNIAESHSIFIILFVDIIYAQGQEIQL